jgi:hypothetical protein
MSHEKPTQDAFLAAIEAKIAAWKAVADSYRAAVSIDGPLTERGGIVTAVGRGAAGTSHADTQVEVVLPIGVFRDKSIKDAIEIYLGAGHRKQTNKEIATGLQKGGIATTSANFEATVATALHRMKAEGTVLRFPDGWDLAASYPDSLRNRLQKDAKPRQKPARAKRGKRRAVQPEDGPRLLTDGLKAAG